MSKNRFEQVDEPQPDAVTLVLRKRDEDGASGTVTCPAGLTAGRIGTDLTTDDMPLKDAFRGAIRLANEIKAPIVVVDPDGLWQSEWGDLYRDEGEEADEA
jgi:hypothetical protein